MSYIDTPRQAPFGAIAIYRAVSAVFTAAETVPSAFRRRVAAPANAAAVAETGTRTAAGIQRYRPLGGAVAAVRAWNARRRTVAELERLTETQLRDIGLTRMDIEELRRGRRLA